MIYSVQNISISFPTLGARRAESPSHQTLKSELILHARAHTYACVCVFIYIYTHTHTHTHICMYACIHTHTHIQGVTGETDQTSGECSLGHTLPI